MLLEISVDKDLLLNTFSLSEILNASPPPLNVRLIIYYAYSYVGYFSYVRSYVKFIFIFSYVRLFLGKTPHVYFNILFNLTNVLLSLVNINSSNRLLLN